MDILWIPVIELAIGIPIALAIRASNVRAEQREREAQEASFEREMEKKREGGYCYSILFKTLRSLQKNGTGGHLITAALRSDELDAGIALAAVQLTRRDAERWCGTSTEDARKHLDTILAILSKAEQEIASLNLE